MSAFLGFSAFDPDGRAPGSLGDVILGPNGVGWVNTDGGYRWQEIPMTPKEPETPRVEVEDLRDAQHSKSIAECIAVARGCRDYGGGHSGECHEAFQHGIDTVVTALEAWAAGDRSLQTMTLLRLGTDEQETS